jgi:dienelactone hydrolase
MEPSMKNRFKQLSQWIKARVKLITPGPNAVKGAAKGLWIFTAIFYVFNGIVMAVSIKDPWVLLLVTAFIILAILTASLSISLINLVYKIPVPVKKALFVCLPLLLITFMNQPQWAVIILLVAALLGASFYVFRKTGFSNLITSKKVVLLVGLFIGLAGLGGGIYFYFLKGLAMDPIENAAKINAEQIPHLSGDSPAKTGVFKVKTMTYGSGKDKHRPEFGQKVTLKTETVNGNAFLDNWEGLAGKWRTKYWGFDAKSLPVNARVWYPEGEGPFPLVLVVHGNHMMTDFSDPGYDYLGALLASRGFIMASVDQNFINGQWMDLFGGLKNENDARGWLLLEHLKVWHKWNATPGHSFFSKIDTSRIALIGHSRGGEAVAHAALLNSLDYYPDDAAVTLDYHFNIRSLIAIAPVDGQYQSGETLTKVEDINYLTIHGSQDADVTSFMGSMQFERIDFTGAAYYFKTGLYIYGANHGQFNTTWGDNDFGISFPGFFNMKNLLAEKDQQEIAKVYISAFLETTLKEKNEYLPLFTDARNGRKWLPETIYLNQFEDAKTRYLAAYDEDFDVQTGSQDAVFLSGDKLSVWREQEIKLKHGKKGSRAVYLGWHYDAETMDTAKEKTISERVPDSMVASYSIQMKPGLFPLDSTAALVFSMAESKEETNPKTKGKWVVEAEEKAEVEVEDKAEVKDKDEDKVKKEDEEKDKKKQAAKPLDLTIELTDQHGQMVRFPLSRFSALQRGLEVRIWKMDFLKGKKESEKIFQKFIFPLAELQVLNPTFSIRQLQQIRFVFDRSENGVVVLDNVGFMNRLDLVKEIGR